MTWGGRQIVSDFSLRDIADLRVLFVHCDILQVVEVTEQAYFREFSHTGEQCKPDSCPLFSGVKTMKVVVFLCAGLRVILPSTMPIRVVSRRDAFPGNAAGRSSDSTSLSLCPSKMNSGDFPYDAAVALRHPEYGQTVAGRKGRIVERCRPLPCACAEKLENFSLPAVRLTTFCTFTRYNDATSIRQSRDISEREHVGWCIPHRYGHHLSKCLWL